jgi:hypothetical protein
MTQGDRVPSPEEKAQMGKNYGPFVQQSRSAPSSQENGLTSSPCRVTRQGHVAALQHARFVMKAGVVIKNEK